MDKFERSAHSLTFFGCSLKGILVAFTWPLGDLRLERVRGHTLITLAHKGTELVRKFEQNANLVNRLYLLNMLTRVLSWSKNVKTC